MYVYWALIFSKIDLYTIRRNTNGSLQYNRVIWIYSSVFLSYFTTFRRKNYVVFFLNFLYHASALLVPKVNTYFCIFVRIHPFWSKGSYSWTILVDFWTLGSKWASSILHTFYIVQLYTVALFFFWLILFLFGCWIFFGYFFCFQYACFFDYFLLFKNFFHHLCIWKRNMRVRGKKLFNKNICFILREK